MLKLLNNVNNYIASDLQIIFNNFKQKPIFWKYFELITYIEADGYEF